LRPDRDTRLSGYFVIVDRVAEPIRHRIRVNGFQPEYCLCSMPDWARWWTVPLVEFDAPVLIDRKTDRRCGRPAGASLFFVRRSVTTRAEVLQQV